MGVAPLLLLPGKAAVTHKMVADVVEALLGAIYLEAGWAAAQRFFDDFILRQDSAPPTPAAEWPRLLVPRHQAHAVHAQLPQHEVGGLLRDLARGKGPRTPLLITPPRRSHTH